MLTVVLAAAILELAPPDETRDRPIPIRSLCGLVDSQVREPADSRYTYSYQRVIYESAGIADSDTEAEARAKVQQFWRTNEEQLTCDVISFEVKGGSLLKFAISRQFDAFITEAVEIWRIDLNRIDPYDGGTVLDYVERDLLRASEGTAIRRTLQRYRAQLLGAGAKRATEVRDATRERAAAPLSTE